MEELIITDNGYGKHYNMKKITKIDKVIEILRQSNKSDSFNMTMDMSDELMLTMEEEMEEYMDRIWFP